MLKVRAEQVEAFQPRAEAAFCRRIVDYLRQNHAEVLVQLPHDVFTIERVADDKLFELVRNAISRARKYGLSWKSTLKGFVVLMFVAAPNFDEHPLIQRVLADQKLPPNSRMNELWKRTSDANWEAVERGYEPAAWLVNFGESFE